MPNDLFDGLDDCHGRSPAGEKAAGRPKGRRERKAAPRPLEAETPHAGAGSLCAAYDVVGELFLRLCTLDERDRRFGRSLITYWLQREALTASQWEWVARLIEKANAGSGAPGIVVLSLTRNSRLVADIAAKLATLKAAALRDFRKSEADRHVDNLVALGVPSRAIRRGPTCAPCSWPPRPSSPLTHGR
jgi:hypothetical protein